MKLLRQLRRTVYIYGFCTVRFHAEQNNSVVSVLAEVQRADYHIAFTLLVPIGYCVNLLLARINKLLVRRIG